MEVLINSLQKQAKELLNDARIAPREVVSLRLIRAKSTCDQLRALVGIDRRVLSIQDQLLSVEFWLEERSRNLHIEPEIQLVASKDSDEFLEELNSLPSETNKLRQRRPSRVESSQRIAIQEKDQQDVSEDILEMVRQIKANAEAFAHKLDSDSDLVSATTDAITRTAGSMTAVGSRLIKYRRASAIGWMFYVWSAVFILAAVFGGMVIIQLFPKW